ncbi:MAG: acyl-CoA dehydrogenase family protein, partial [Pseudomonadota bacterium]|nr:acyl-CoA dehydrogenase family protein [Pseudomonadota bacterium]
MPDSAMVHEQETLILQTLEQFLERDVRPHVMELEHNDIWPEEIVHKMAELGLFGAIIDEEYGGLGLPCSTYAKICEKVAHTWMSLAGIFNSHLIMSAAVQRYGTDVQKKKWLPKFAMGELRGGIALTEPNCGTDLQAIRTRAAKNG